MYAKIQHNSSTIYLSLQNLQLHYYDSNFNSQHFTFYQEFDQFLVFTFEVVLRLKIEPLFWW